MVNKMIRCSNILAVKNGLLSTITYIDGTRLYTETGWIPVSSYNIVNESSSTYLADLIDHSFP